MALVDVTIVNVAIPTMQLKLHASGAALQLVVSGYTIAYAMLLVTGARLGQLRGPRLLFMSGLLTFTFASLACGFAPNATALICARFVQGAGAAAMVPQLISVIQLRFTGGARVRALSVYSATLASGAVVGQILGGVLVSANIFGASWRVVFLVNVPVGLVLACLVPRFVPADRVPTGQRLDLRGLFVLATAVLLVVVPLVLGREEGWPAWAWASMVAGLVGVAAFVAIERTVVRRGGNPLLNIRVFEAKGIRPAVAVLAIGMIGYGGFLFSLALHLQRGLGDSPLKAGLTFAPAAAMFGLVSFLWRRVPAAMFAWLPLAGLAVAGAGYVALAASLQAGGWWLLLPLIVVGGGLAMAFAPAMSLALLNVPAREAPDASGLLTTVIQLAQVVGVAVFGSVFLSLAAHHHVGASTDAATTLFYALAAFTLVGVPAAVRLAKAVRPAR